MREMRGLSVGMAIESIRLRNEIFGFSVHRTRRRLVGELADGVDAPPDGRAIVIILGGKLVGARGAFLERLIAVPLEHQVGGSPDVDFGYHTE